MLSADSATKKAESSRLFSPSAIDRGTLAMLSHADLKENDIVLDLGCGYGVVGIFAAKKLSAAQVVMSDVSAKAVNVAKRNAELNKVPEISVELSDGFQNLTGQVFSVILSNPPYHTDFSVAKHFIEDGFRHLSIGGRMLMVTKRLDWYKNKLTSVFGGVRVYEEDGYYVFITEKRAAFSKKKEKGSTDAQPIGMSKKLARKEARKSRR